MATMYCALCSRPVEANRQIGAGTIVLGLVTGGVWFLAVPFYPKRCSICKSTAVSDTSPDGALPRASKTGSGTALQRIEDLEQRLSLTQAELESTNTALDRVRTERDFYRQLLADPARKKEPG